MTYTIDVQSTRRFPAPLIRAVAAAANECEKCIGEGRKE